MTSELGQRIDATISKAENAAEKWLKENEYQIECKVYQMLDQKLQEIVAKIMGFDNCSGKWEVDHCNGRRGESIAGDWIKIHAKEAIERWLEEQIGSLPNLPATAIKDLKKNYLEYLKDWINKALMIEARERAEKMIGQVLGGEFHYDGK